MIVTGPHRTAQLRRRSFLLVDSTIPQDVTLDAWRQVGIAPRPVRARSARLASAALRAIRTPKVRVT